MIPIKTSEKPQAEPSTRSMSSAPPPIVQWRDNRNILEMVGEILGQDLSEDHRARTLVNLTTQDHRASDTLRAALDHEKTQLAKKLMEAISPERWREIRQEIRTQQPPRKHHEPNMESILHTALDTAEAGNGQPQGWERLAIVRYETPDLFIALQNIIRNHQPSRQLAWEIEAELERIATRIADKLRKPNPPPAIQDNQALWPPNTLWSRSWEKQ